MQLLNAVVRIAHQLTGRARFGVVCDDLSGVQFPADGSLGVRIRPIAPMLHRSTSGIGFPSDLSTLAISHEGSHARTVLTPAGREALLNDFRRQMEETGKVTRIPRLDSLLPDV